MSTKKKKKKGQGGWSFFNLEKLLFLHLKYDIAVFLLFISYNYAVLEIDFSIFMPLLELILQRWWEREIGNDMHETLIHSLSFNCINDLY